MSIHGTEYRVNAVMHIGWEDEMPTFASIAKLVIPESRRVYFVLKQYKTQQFDKHYHAFQVCRPQEEITFILQQNDFKHYMPAHEVRLCGMLYIAQRCTIPQY